MFQCFVCSCFFLTILSILGSVHDRATRMSCSISSLFLFLLFMLSIVEKPASHTYVVTKGINIFIARFVNSGKLWTWEHQNSSRVSVWNWLFRTLFVLKSTNSSFASSLTSIIDGFTRKGSCIQASIMNSPTPKYPSLLIHQRVKNLHNYPD